MVSDEDDNYLELKGMRHTVTMSCYNPERDTHVGLLDINNGEANALFDYEDIEAIHRWSGNIIKQHEAAYGDDPRRMPSGL